MRSGSLCCRSRRSIGLVCASLVSLGALSTGAHAAPPGDFAPHPATVLRYGPAWRYPQAGWIIVHIEGAPYERGYQHGLLLAGEIVEYLRAIAAQRSAAAPAEAWRDLRLLTDALFLRRYDAEWLEEMKGIADGAAAAGAKFDGRSLDLLDIVTLNADVEVGFLEAGLQASPTGQESRRFAAPQHSVPRARRREHCSAFVATGPATADGRIVLGHNTMSSLGYVTHFNIWLDIQPAKGHRVVFQTFPGGIESGLDYYLCSSGLIVAETTIEQTWFDPNGEPLASRIRRAVQYADSIDDVTAILGRDSNGLYTNQWLLGDIRTNEIAMFELGTKRTRLWRSSKEEWPDGSRGFYWGCNNSRDSQVLAETVPDLRGKPANLVRRPRSRDAAWVRLFEQHPGRIDEAFAFEAFESAPLSAFPTCDAKFTTAALAQDLQSWALFGPPLGRTWLPTESDRKKYPDIQPLVANDWALLRGAVPDSAAGPSGAADLSAFPRAAESESLEVKFDARHPFAWRGTLLPASPADTWLAAGFAEYEHVVALEHACRVESKDGKLSRAAQDLVDLALFAHESRWLAAVRRMGADPPLRDTRADRAARDWYDHAAGKGVLLLAALRAGLGAAVCDSLLDEFGMAHAGQQVTTDQFLVYCRQRSGEDAVRLVEAWLAGNSQRPPHDDRNIWTIFSFEAEPERTLIVYGTLGDRAAQREAAELLQRGVARRFSNLLPPIRSDLEATEEELRGNHLLLVGRPETNSVAARCLGRNPVTFDRQTFTVRGQHYGNARSAVLAAGDNALNPRFSAVVCAGLSAAATWKCVQRLPEDDDEAPAPQVLLLPAGGRTQAFRMANPSLSIAAP